MPKKLVMMMFRAAHALLAFLFACAALMLIAISARVGWQILARGLEAESAMDVIELAGVLAAAVVALQIAETITEEEVIRNVDISGPTRVRRFLSRFFVVVVVALAIEGLVATFKAVREDLASLVYPASILLATAALLAAWGVFVRFNRAAEELEPEAMAEVKREDRKLQ